LTPGDGRPRRAGGWAWHGLAVPFTLHGSPDALASTSTRKRPLVKLMRSTRFGWRSTSASAINPEQSSDSLRAR
jgi:hypothetical protein